MGGLMPMANSNLEPYRHLISELVSIPSINPAFAGAGQDPAWFGEAAVGDFVADFLTRAGLDVARLPVDRSRTNIVGWLESSGSKRRLLLETHMDTVQVTNMTVPPFGPFATGNRVYGRGATDAKGSLAAMLAAMQRLAQNGSSTSSIGVAAVVDEEYGYRGVKELLRHSDLPDAAIVGEPTELRVAIACKGCIRWRIHVKGRGGHTSKPHGTLNAIECAADLLTRLTGELRSDLIRRAHPLVGPPTLSTTGITGGTGPNTVPQECVVTFDRRTVPGESNDAAMAEVNDIARQVEADWPGTELLFEPPFVEDSPMEADPTSRIAAVFRATSVTLGREPEPIGVPFGCDASKFALVGIPVVVFGPGSISQAHAADEFIDVNAVADASFMLERVARAF